MMILTFFKVTHMLKEMKVSVFEIVGSTLCIASNDGQKVFERIQAALKKDRIVILSFLSISTLTSAFLNTAIGQLYGSFSEDQIRKQLKVQDMHPEDKALLKRVVDTAKQYFKDPNAFTEIIKEVQGE